MELNRKIDSALVGGRVSGTQTMHLTHGLREFFPFDDTTTLQDVEEHLRKCYQDSIHEYITKFTADLLPDGPIRLQFYAGSPRDGVEARPLNPETRVATLPGVDTDGVYWWPQSKQPLREPRLTFYAGTMNFPTSSAVMTFLCLVSDPVYPVPDGFILLIILAVSERKAGRRKAFALRGYRTGFYRCDNQGEAKSNR